MKSKPLTRDQWQAQYPWLNPDYMTPFGLAWTLTQAQRDELTRRDDEQVRRDEQLYGA